MGRSLKIAFVCVNYNNSSVTLSYVKNVISLSGNYDVKVVVVDNASKDEEFNQLLSELKAFPEVKLIRSEKNGGYFYGLNLGIRFAIESGYDQYQVVGNNDIEFHPEFMDVLQQLPLLENELVISPDIITNNNIHENPHIIHRVSFMRRLIYRIYYSNYYIAKLVTLFYSDERKHKEFDPERKYIYMGIGALYVLTPNFFKHFDRLWDLLFLYGEEAVFGGQIASVNGKILYEPKLKCNHNESATTSRMSFKDKYHIVRKSYFIYRKFL